MIGINCHFDPDVVLAGLKLMKEALVKAGYKKHLMAQPLAFKTPDATKQGFIDLPEFPFGELWVLGAFSAQRATARNSVVFNIVNVSLGHTQCWLKNNSIPHPLFTEV